ncbi:MAG: methylenetetrahydrofolate--tRNA-(uracil(54)-C(5))-methyltransferase (FADH(2)-oxidizing) TrmFO [Clostridia bacterium]|nr:methylenetetrahydrofolate--tRNA-(uracil(54)-C(5))-methyltransferase (FADH(2)-oxidizing) TrmFO [Clostridia bacterium]
MKATVIGAGLAGCEAAYYLANRGVKVTIIEQKPSKMSPAHHNENFAELVCSNSLKADRVSSAGGLLKAEMRLFGSLCLAAADECRVPAGGALAVDRHIFSQIITHKIKAHENIEVVYKEQQTIPNDGVVIVATGPLTDGEMADEISRLCGNSLSFFDAAAPIISADSIDKDTSFAQSRYDRGEDDYINCPLNKEEYEAFHAALITAEIAPLKSFDKAPTVYEGCMPIEIMAKRGADTIRFGPMKPVGLRDPKTGHRPWAVLQLRKENSDGTMYNMVGFQTNLKFGEQKRVFSMIPALKNAEFVRYGVMHRNSFINSPKLLTSGFNMRENANIFFAGQITGVEGYMESAMSGILAAVNALRVLKGEELITLPATTMMGALSRYISDDTVENFQPMGASFGLLPSLNVNIRDKKQRYQALADRALEDLKNTGVEKL